MMAPYAIGHIKMSLLLEEFGYKLHEEERIKFYLTNTLEIKDLEQTEFPGMTSLAEESHLAGKIKKETPILVILGNPPYSGQSANINVWIDKLLKEDTEGMPSYYKVNSQSLGERNPKWLQDDYVKFIRFAQWKINQAGEGILGFITNHSYLDNPTFRGMRQSLMQTFDEIYLLDLHGSALKKEKCPDGSKDENVFDIKQGVAIGIFIKYKNSKPDKRNIKICDVRHAEIWGLRENKYDWLERHDIDKTKWEKLIPKSEYYLFIPREDKFLCKYEKYPKITDIFLMNSVGIVTSRDEFTIDTDKEALKRRIRSLIDDKLTDDLIQQAFKLRDKMNWKLKKAREILRKNEDRQDSIKQILYRPFDVRWIFYDESLIERTRREIMEHMMQENLGLLTCRQQNIGGFYHSLICNIIVESCVLSNKTREINYLFPLYVYNIQGSKKKRSSSHIILLFEPEGEYALKKPNLSPDVIKILTDKYKKILKPEPIFYYIYAVLYSDIYRSKYTEFLKIDFPRIPFTTDYRIFSKFANYGEQLTDLHLLKSSYLLKTNAKLTKGTNRVEKVRYEKEEVYINEKQYFEGIARAVWEYQIGGYRVCEKWLKDRKGRELSSEDIKHYCRIVTALQKTIEIQKKIDRIYPEVEKSTIDFKK